MNPSCAHDSKFGGVCAASLLDTYSLQDDGSLHVLSVVRSGSRVESTLQIYRFAESWQPQNDWANGGVLGVGNIFRNPFSR